MNLHRDTVLHVIAALLVMAALLHPAIPLKRDLHNYLLVADVTQSMNVKDMPLDNGKVSRLAHTRHLMQAAVASLSCGSHVSLGVFTAESIALLFTPIEVCANFDVLQDSIAHLEWRMAWRGNSRLRFGLKAASATLDALPMPARMVFFTDGDEAPRLNAVNTLDLSHWQGGHGWLLVGVGGDAPMPIPKFDSENRILGYWATANMILAPSQVQSEESLGTRDDTIASDDYNRYLSRLEEPYLKELGREIGAQYVRGDDQEALVAAMQRQPSAGRGNTHFPLTRPLLGLSFLMLLASYYPALAAACRAFAKRRKPF